MRTLSSRVASFNYVSEIMSAKGNTYASDLNTGTSNITFNMSSVVYVYLSDSIGANMSNVSLADKELDYLIKYK